MDCIIYFIIGFAVYWIGYCYGSRIGMGEILALLIAHPEKSAQDIRDRMDELSRAEDATFEERIGKWAVRNCDERLEFFKEIC